MKKIFIILCLSVTDLVVAQPNTWIQKPDVGWIAANGPSARMLSVSFTTGSKGYFGTGQTATNFAGYQNDFWEYDPATKVWTQKATIGGARSGAVGFSINGKGYVGLGNNSFTLYDFYEYNPVTNQWVQKANFPGQNVVKAVGFSIGPKGYVGTGSFSTASRYKWFYEYNPATNTWTQKAPFGGTGRVGATGFSIGDKGYIGTGTDSSGATSDFWEYDTTANVWTQKANFGGGITSGAASFSSATKGYIATASGVSSSFWEYDPSVDSWTQKAAFGGMARGNARGFFVAGNGYIGSGLNSVGSTKMLNDFWKYDIAADTWTFETNLGAVLRRGASSFSIGSKGYVVLGTGYGSVYPMNDCWAYDQVTNTWSQKADFPGLGRELAVGMTIGNKGYVGIGYDYWITAYYNDFWEYDTVANSWTQRANFPGAPRYSPFCFAVGNKGYVGAGRNATSSFSDFWEYDPATDSWLSKATSLFFGVGVGFGVGNKGYAVQGSGAWMYPYEYNPATNTWTAKSIFNAILINAAVFVIGNCGYLATGTDNSGNFYTDVLKYNATTDTWAHKAPFPGYARHQAFGFGIGTKGYVGTGLGFVSSFPATFNDFWEYTPDSLTTEVEEIFQDKLSLILFPNPTSSELIIQNSGLKIEEIEMYSSLGEKVFSQPETSNQQHVTISVADFPPGIYFITVTDQAGNKVTKKVVKM